MRTMSERQRHREVPVQNRAGEHLANERTFLAWIRTTIAVVSSGFVLARFLPALPTEAEGPTFRLAAKGRFLGIGMIVLGAILTVLAAWRYDTVNREIEDGRVKTDRALVWFVTVAIAILSAALAAYAFVSE